MNRWIYIVRLMVVIKRHNNGRLGVRSLHWWSADMASQLDIMTLVLLVSKVQISASRVHWWTAITDSNGNNGWFNDIEPCGIFKGFEKTSDYQRQISTSFLAKLEPMKFLLCTQKLSFSKSSAFCWITERFKSLRSILAYHLVDLFYWRSATVKAPTTRHKIRTQKHMMFSLQDLWQDWFREKRLVLSLKFSPWTVGIQMKAFSSVIILKLFLVKVERKFLKFE